MIKTAFPLYKTLGDTHFRIDLAHTAEQKHAVYAMRYQIFNVELKQGLQASTETAMDCDDYDKYCDHLLVIHDDTDEIVGTYRLLPYQRVKDNVGLYSETEFDLTQVRRADLPLVEVGRACIAPAFRDGSVINMLWLGLATYMQAHKLQYMCGCASLNKEDDAQMASMIYQYCKATGKLVDEALRVTPNAQNKMPDFDMDFQIDDVKKIKRQIPLLLRGYFSLSCQIGGEPAYDPEFGVIDFFIWLNLATIAKGARRFFGGDTAASL